MLDGRLIPGFLTCTFSGVSFSLFVMGHPTVGSISATFALGCGIWTRCEHREMGGDTYDDDDRIYDDIPPSMIAPDDGPDYGPAADSMPPSMLAPDDWD